MVEHCIKEAIDHRLMDLLDGIQSGDFIDIYADTYKK